MDAFENVLALLHRIHRLHVHVCILNRVDLDAAQRGGSMGCVSQWLAAVDGRLERETTWHGSYRIREMGEKKGQEKGWKSTGHTLGLRSTARREPLQNPSSLHHLPMTGTHLGLEGHPHPRELLELPLVHLLLPERGRRDPLALGRVCPVLCEGILGLLDLLLDPLVEVVLLLLQGQEL